MNAERVTGIMSDHDGWEVSFGIDDEGLVVLRVGGRKAVRLDDSQQQEFLRRFHGAQLAGSEPPT